MNDRLFVGDIGGTSTRLSIFSDGSFLFEKHYPSKDFPSLEAIITRYRDEINTPLPQKACLAVAGAVENNRVKATNLQWIVDGEELKRIFDFHQCELINDFEAVALGVLEIGPEHLIKLGGGIPAKDAPKAVLGAGTGMGQAILIPGSDGFTVIPTEGGHSDFAPKTPIEIELLQHLMKEKNHVSVEMVLSGPGLLNIYRFLHLKKTSRPGPYNKPSEITNHALNGDDPVCVEALNIFVSIYGAEAGNLALKTLARGGVYIAGGIAPKILPFMKKEIFRKAFESKGRLKGVLEKIPVFVVTHPRLGLMGAAVIGQ